MKIAAFGGIRIIDEFKRLFKEEVEIAFFLDNNAKKIGNMIKDKKLYSPYNFPRGVIEYIIVFVYEYESVSQELIDLGVEASHIINFNSSNLDLALYESIFNVEVAEQMRLRLKIDYLERKIKRLEDSRQYFEQNYAYEMVGKLKSEKIRIPALYSVEETCEKIISDKCSMSRYGDGEFEIMLGHAKDIYQGNNEKLAQRLQSILKSNLEKHIVAIADDYGDMKGIREENKNTIRKYMTPEKREKHYHLLDMDKKYYNAYISRPYVIYPHDEIEEARERFTNLQRIWDKQEVLFVEGDRTRMGVGNDLFNNVKNIERIIAPNENAFDVYDEIYQAALQYGKDKLILIALGPTATALAFDLAKEGYWALDIGHLDLEYEWFLKGKGYGYIPHKYNNEMPGDTNVTLIDDKAYSNSVVCRIEI